MSAALTDDLAHAAHATLEAAMARGWMLATAESCTGGLVAAALTEIPGSSAAIGFGLVTYSNEAKMRLLSVRPATLEAFGAVSVETAGEMAQGALAASGADLAVSITGIAGPTGGSAAKPVGTVCFGLAGSAIEPCTERHHYQGDRAAVRKQAAKQALAMLLEACQVKVT